MVKEFDTRLGGVSLNELGTRLGGTLIRGAGDAGTATKLWPSNTCVMSDRPTFEWSKVETADHCTIVLMDDHSTRLWRRDSTASTYGLAYPAAERSLLRGQTYFWEISMQLGDVTQSMAVARFRVLGSYDADLVRKSMNEIEAARKADKDDLTADTLLAALFLNYRLHDDAIVAYRALEEDYPREAAVHRALEYLYTKEGMFEEADNERELTKGGKPD